MSTNSPTLSVSSLSDVTSPPHPDVDLQPEYEETQDTGRFPDPAPAEPHPSFYELLIIKVESTLFRLPATVVKKHPTAFKKLLALMALGDPRTDPIPLSGISVTDFERFLNVLIPPDDKRYDLSTLAEWTSVLRVAHLWDFSLIRNRALAQLKLITTSVDKVVLGQEYDVPEWVAIGYSELCHREVPINNEEGRRLGVDDVVDISSIRHHLRAQILKSGLHGLHPSSSSLTSGPLRQALGPNRVADYLAESPTVNAVELRPFALQSMTSSMSGIDPLYYGLSPMQAGLWQRPVMQDQRPNPFPMTLRELSISAWAALLICLIYVCCARM